MAAILWLSVKTGGEMREGERGYLKLGNVNLTYIRLQPSQVAALW